MPESVAALRFPRHDRRPGRRLRPPPQRPQQRSDEEVAEGYTQAQGENDGEQQRQRNQHGIHDRPTLPVMPNEQLWIAAGSLKAHESCAGAGVPGCWITGVFLISYTRSLWTNYFFFSAFQMVREIARPQNGQKFMGYRFGRSSVERTA